MSWTKEKVENLKRLREAGLLSSEIATALGMTRNAIIAKANRMGFATPNQAPVTKKDQRVLAKAVFIKPKKVKAVKPMPPEYQQPEGVAFDKLKSHQCQYGLDNGKFCGERIYGNLNNRPYCQHHLCVIYDKSGTRRLGDYQKRMLRELSYREAGANGPSKDEVARIVNSELGV